MAGSQPGDRQFVALQAPSHGFRFGRAKTQNSSRQTDESTGRGVRKFVEAAVSKVRAWRIASFAGLRPQWRLGAGARPRQS